MTTTDDDSRPTLLLGEKGSRIQQQESSPSFLKKHLLVLLSLALLATVLVLFESTDRWIDLDTMTLKKPQEVVSGKGVEQKTAPGVPRLAVIPKPDPFPPLIVTKVAIQHPRTRLAGQFMLDFAVVGHAKCGTTTLMKWLGGHPEIFVPSKEIRSLQSSGDRAAGNLIQTIAKSANHTNNPQLLRGYKSPNDILVPDVVRHLRDFFPETKLIVGIRHPVLMLESFYNHRMRSGYHLKPFEKMEYDHSATGVSWARAFYHGNLAQLGKTNVSDPEERELLPDYRLSQFRKNFPEPSPNKVYLYETSQLGDSNETRLQQLQTDLQNYLGLTKPLPKPHDASPHGNSKNAEERAQREERTIDICDDKYAKTRARHLRAFGKKLSTWIIDYFIDSPDVYVPNRDHFISLVNTFDTDPCPARNAAAGEGQKNRY